MNNLVMHSDTVTAESSQITGGVLKELDLVDCMNGIF